MLDGDSTGESAMVSLLSLCQVGELGLGILRYYAILSADFNDNNLFAMSPKIAKEWAAEFNGDKTPENTLNGSAYKAWWICGEGHYFHKRVCDRTGKRVRAGKSYGGCQWCKGYGKYKIYIPPDIEKIKNKL